MAGSKQQLSSTLISIPQLGTLSNMKVMGFSASSRTVTRCKRTLIGFWLASLYVVCVFLVVYSLSTYQFQIKLNSIPQSSSLSENSFTDHLCNTSKFDANTEGPLATIPCIPNAPNEESQFYSTGEVLSIYKNLNEVIAADIALIEQRQQSFKENKIKQKKALSADPNNEVLQLELRLIEGNIHRVDLELRDKRDLQAKYILKHNVLIDTFSDIEYFEKFFQGFSSLLGIDSFWAIPTPILIIILVLSMGVLGSLIFVTVEFLQEPESYPKSLSMYLFRPFLGMILALSMYVMLKSGQSTFSDSSEQNLSPFLISFLGIVSGMLAEQAYKRLSITGGSVLNGELGNSQEAGQQK